MKLIFSTIALIPALALSGCAPASAKKKSLNLGIAVYDGDDTFIASITEELSELAEADGVHYTIRNADHSQLTQNEQVKDMIDDGMNVICVNLVDRTSTSSIINAAMKNNIPIIFFNREPVESDIDRWDQLYYVGSDPEESGRMQGQIAAAYIREHPETDRNGDGTLQVYVLEGEPGHQDTILRSESSLATLQDAGITVEKLGYSICDWKRSEAEEEVTDLINANTETELFLCNNDDMAAGAVDAYEAAGIPVEQRALIVGIDGTAVGCQLVRENQLIGTVYNDYRGQAAAIYQLAEALGGECEMPQLVNGHYITLSYQKITIDNVSEFE